MVNPPERKKNHEQKNEPDNSNKSNTNASNSNNTIVNTGEKKVNQVIKGKRVLMIEMV